MLAAVLAGAALSGLGGLRAGGGDEADDDAAAIPVTGGEPPPDTGGDSPFGDSADPERGSAQAEPGLADLSPTPPLGSWRELPEAPVRGRTQAVAVWTGQQALFWGGLSGGRGPTPLRDGAAYDPSADSWESIGEAPRDWRPADTAVWTGEEMVVVGHEQPLAYDPRADEWRSVAEAPPGGWVWESAAWTGEEILVISDGTADRPAVTAYDVEADGWRSLPDPPLETWEGWSSAWFDGRLVLVGATDTVRPDRNAVTVLDLETEEWSQPDPAPAAAGWLPRVIADSRLDRVLMAGSHEPVPPVVLDWAPGRGWGELPDLPRTPLGSPGVLLETGHGLLLWRDDIPSRTALMRRDAEWAPVADPPLSEGFSGAAVWTGEELLVWGREPGEPGRAVGAALRLDPVTSAATPPESADVLDGSWRWLRKPPSGRVSPSLDWAGDRLLVWGGSDGGPVADGLAYYPLDGHFELLREAPIPGRVSHESAWTGQELLVWGGTNTRAARDGAAYDPRRRTWRSIPDAPIAGGSTVSAWTGEELIAISGPRADEPQAAAYDPAADSWRLMPDPPGTRRRLAAVWTGEEIVLVSEARHGAVLRYDPRRDSWARGASAPGELPSIGVEAAWTGEEVLLWGGGDLSSPVGWAYDPAGDAWRRLPEVWLGRGERSAEAAAAWTGDVWIVAGVDDGGGRGLAAYDPAGDQWLAVRPPGGAELPGGPLAWTDTEVIWWEDGHALAFRPER